LKYKIPKPKEGTETTNTTAILVAKAYDPVSGVCLKYETNRAVEVGRLILGFQELGQVMQNIPRTKRKESSGDDDREPMAIDEPKREDKVDSNAQAAAEAKSSPAKKKKKGKR
jgi:hypothetical protein